MSQAQIDKLQNEGGEGYSQAEVNQESAGLAKLAAEQAAFAAEWTAEVLAARKAAWNAEVMAVGRAMNGSHFQRIAKKLGYSLNEINRAKALHA
jgi:predicted nuclease of restriction endonuclease-like RecB superfamily